MNLLSVLCRVLLVLLGYTKWCAAVSQFYLEGTEARERFRVEGTVEQPLGIARSDKHWIANTRVYTSTGYVAFLHENGTFVFNNLAWGSHNVWVSSPSTAYEPIRIDVTFKGRVRARKLDVLQPSKVDLVSGPPLKLIPLGPIRYFQAREQWRVTDLLFNPMVLMTVLPLGLLLILPKFSDPETRKEMESQLQMPKTDTPDLSEIMTNFFKTGSTSSATPPPAVTGDSSRRSVGGGGVSRGGGTTTAGRGGRRR